MSHNMGKVLATAIGVLFASSTFATDSSAQASDANVKCTGINACKGQGSCKTAANACKGQNTCKGMGIMMVATEKECTDKGGVVQK